MSSQLKIDEEREGPPKDCPLLSIAYTMSWLRNALKALVHCCEQAQLPTSPGTGVYEPQARTHGLVRDLAIGQIGSARKMVNMQVEGCTRVAKGNE